jgi:hypothetical protein
VKTTDLICDGCGQVASAGHIAGRLARLEQATRFRPVHIRTLLLGAISPSADEEFLYSPGAEVRGEAADLLAAAEISPQGKAKEAILSEFQRLGLFATYVLECPLDPAENNAAGAEILIRERLAAVLPRIRRSLKPKRVILFSAQLDAFVHDFNIEQLGCPVVTDEGKSFRLNDPLHASHMRQLLGAAESRLQAHT